MSLTGGFMARVSFSHDKRSSIGATEGWISGRFQGLVVAAVKKLKRAAWERELEEANGEE